MTSFRITIRPYDNPRIGFLGAAAYSSAIECHISKWHIRVEENQSTPGTHSNNSLAALFERMPEFIKTENDAPF
jgi:hypothetical protein